MAYESCGDYQNAIIYYEQRLELARETQDIRSERQALDSIKTAYYAMGEYTKAMEYENIELITSV